MTVWISMWRVLYRWQRIIKSHSGAAVIHRRSEHQLATSRVSNLINFKSSSSLPSSSSSSAAAASFVCTEWASTNEPQTTVWHWFRPSVLGPRAASGRRHDVTAAILAGDVVTQRRGSPWRLRLSTSSSPAAAAGVTSRWRQRRRHVADICWEDRSRADWNRKDIRRRATANCPGVLPVYLTDLYNNTLDAVPTIHIVSNHEATDKLTTQNGGLFTNWAD